MTGWMLFFFILLAVSVLTLIGVAVAVHVRVRKKIGDVAEREAKPAVHQGPAGDEVGLTRK